MKVLKIILLVLALFLLAVADTIIKDNYNGIGIPALIKYLLFFGILGLFGAWIGNDD